MFKIVFVICFFLSISAARPSLSCRCMPSDACWPSPAEWASFNKTLEGKLVATTPLALPCHAPNYNAATCQYLKAQWTNPFIQ